jgi:hypothetical protein
VTVAVDAGPPAVAAAAPAVHDAAPTAAASPDAAGPEAAVAAAEEEPDEEALLRTAVPNAEQAVIGAEGAEPAPAKPEIEKPAPEAPVKTPTRGVTKAPPPPKPKPQTAILHIRTTPVGAVVKTKYQVLGRTPLNLHFRTGNVYELTFVKSGYQQASRTVNVTNAKDRTVALSLKKKAAAPKKRSFLRMHR